MAYTIDIFIYIIDWDLANEYVRGIRITLIRCNAS